MVDRIWADAVRKGDQIRVVIKAGETTSFQYEAAHDGDDGGIGGSAVFRYLVRRSPAVTLPTEPTLGWIESEERSDLGWFALGDVAVERHAVEADATLAREFSSAGHQVDVVRRVKSFTPATAIPSVALEAFRTSEATTAMEAFSRKVALLAAVDAANGGDPR